MYVNTRNVQAHKCNLLHACKVNLLNAFNCNLQSYNGKLHVYYDNLSG